ncbi:AMP-binding protein [Actinomadura sp. WMMB 499]|uniref:AMP-binding protein n=1 Tax=Actinomadura sp. WMMB 499 TaxID=1219491 RepID=UPI0020C7D0B5|nr:AMP-binding protein [Actinomadura sp. WMMB 499]
MTIEDVATLVRRAADRAADRPAWTFDGTGETLTFGEVADRSAALARGLAGLGVRRGDRVAALLPNVPDFPLLWLALARLGAVLVPLNLNYRTHDAGHVLSDSGAKLLVTTRAHADLAERLGVPVHYTEDGTPEAEAVLDRSRPEDLLNIQYTSGTTGLPKGCLLPHRYWTSLADSMVTAFPHLDGTDVMLTCQPFSYVDPQWNVLAGLRSGAHLVVLDRFHPASFWEKVREYGVTYFYCLGLMPPLLLRMPPGPHDRDHAVRAIQCSAIPPTLHRALEERWGVPWFEAFGMTETGADLRVDPGDHDETVGTGCIGRPLPHRDVRIVGADGEPVPRGTAGEIVLRGIGLMDGYLGHEDATARAFRRGWFHTGDLGRMDERGRVYYTGRLKDMIRRSGENISAAEVEEVLLGHPAVRAAALVPVPDELRGEEAMAYVAADGAVSPADLAAYCDERLAYFKVPRYWMMRDELPMTASARVAKGELSREPGGAYDRAAR